MIKKFRPSRTLALLMFSWGLLTIILGCVTNYGGLVAVRFLLGSFEAGLFPGLVVSTSSRPLVTLFLCLTSISVLSYFLVHRTRTRRPHRSHSCLRHPRGCIRWCHRIRCRPHERRPWARSLALPLLDRRRSLLCLRPPGNLHPPRLPRKLNMALALRPHPRLRPSSRNGLPRTLHYHMGRSQADAVGLETLSPLFGVYLDFGPVLEYLIVCADDCSGAGI